MPGLSENDAHGVKRKHTSLLDTAAELERRLPLIKVDAVATAALADDVRRRLRAGHDAGAAADEPSSTDAGAPTHQAGVRLWNQALRLSREDRQGSPAPQSPYRRLLLHSRVFALAAIHRSTWSGQPADARTPAQALYLLGVAVRAARSCQDDQDVELGRLVLDLASGYRQTLETASPLATNADRFKKLQTDLFVLETAQFWKEGKLPAAEALFNEAKTQPLRDALDVSTAELLAGTLFEIGRDLLAKRDFGAAVTWLDRADAILVSQGPVVRFSDSMKSLRVAVMHALALAALGLESQQGHQRAAQLVQGLRAEMGDDDPRVHLVQLEVIAASPSGAFDAGGYSEILRRMISSFSGTATEFQMLHHHIQKLHNKSPGLGCDVLDEFMLALRHKDAVEWIEKLVITRVWLLAHQREAQEGLDSAEHVLSKLRMPINADTAVAAQTLMWKRIEQGYQEKQYATAVRWCRLALCHVFEAGGRSNRALIERKLLLCSIESGDLETAQSTYVSMSESTRDEPMTKYLLYKLSIKMDDVEMATECLRSVSTVANGKELLYACIIHARHAKAPRFMVQALKKLADAINHSSDPGPIHTPALFRCTILMLRDIIDSCSDEKNRGDDQERERATALHDLSDIFEGVIEAIKTSRDKTADTEAPLFPDDELEWFCRAAYNLGLKYSGQSSLRNTVCILSSCIKIAKIFPARPELNITTDLTSKLLNCHFLIASALAALARRPDQPVADGQVLKDYLVMREHVAAFQTELKQSQQSNENLSPDILSKLSVLLIFDFEGAIGLGDWDELEGICEKAVVCQNSDTFRVLGDCLLRSQGHAPSQKFVAVMRCIVNHLHSIGGFGNDKLIKYYRCLFQAALYRDNDAAFLVLEEACQLAQGEIVTTEDNWPENELQFLAVTAFNEGIDWFAGGREEQARQWALSAMRLAGRCQDGGKLKAQISERFSLLKIGDLEVKPSVEMDVLEVSMTTTECTE